MPTHADRTRANVSCATLIVWDWQRGAITRRECVFRLGAYFTQAQIDRLLGVPMCGTGAELRGRVFAALYPAE